MFPNQGTQGKICQKFRHTSHRLIPQQCSPTKDRPSNQEDPASFRNDYFQHQPNKQAPPYHKIAHTRRERPLLVPDRYNGNTSWDEYEQHFEACNQVNGWDDRQAAVYLTASLQGSALRTISNIGPGSRDSYHDLRRILANVSAQAIRRKTT